MQLLSPPAEAHACRSPCSATREATAIRRLHTTPREKVHATPKSTHRTKQINLLNTHTRTYNGASRRPSACTAAAAKSLQSCPTLCSPRDGSPHRLNPCRGRKISQAMQHGRKGRTRTCTHVSLLTLSVLAVSVSLENLDRLMDHLLQWPQMHCSP